MERFVQQLADSAGAESSLFISVDRMTGWAWIALMADAAPDAIARLSAFAASQRDALRIAVGDPLPNVDGFRRSHEQAQSARTVAIASAFKARRVTVAGDPGVAAAALMGNDLGAAHNWVAEVLGPLASCTENDERLRETLAVFLRPAPASRPPPRNCIFIPIQSNIACIARWNVVGGRSTVTALTSKSRCCCATGMATLFSPLRPDVG